MPRCQGVRGSAPSSPGHLDTPAPSSLDRANAALAKLVTAYAGGEKFGAAIASGDVCTRGTAAARRRVCNECPQKCNASLFGLVPSSWCGPPLEDRTDDAYGSSKTCGCLLLGKTMVASERCPQGRWGPAPRRDHDDSTESE